MFCVFSGTKVEELRQFLKREFAPSTPSSASFDDDSPNASFTGSSSAPAGGRFQQGLHRINDHFDWAAAGMPPPPPFWGQQHQQQLSLQTPPPPPPPPNVQQRFDPTLFNPVLPPAPPFPGNHGPMLPPRRFTPNTQNMQAPLAQSAPSQPGPNPFIPVPHSAGSSQVPFPSPPIIGGPQASEASSNVQSTLQSPSPNIHRGPGSPANAQQAREQSQAAATELMSLIRHQANHHPMTANQRHRIPPSPPQDHQQGPQLPAPQRTPTSSPSPAPRGNENPTAFPPTLLDDDYGGVDL